MYRIIVTFMFLSIFQVEFLNHFRGEKLYVTKDKRIKSKWRKWLCYAIVLALVGGGLLVGILAACMY